MIYYTLINRSPSATNDPGIYFSYRNRVAEISTILWSVVGDNTNNGGNAAVGILERPLRA